MPEYNELKELERAPRDVDELHDLAMEIMNYIFSKANKYLTIPMPWGDDKEASGRKPSVITDQAIILQSGVPPYWENDKRVAFRFDAGHAGAVEFGSPPHSVPVSAIEPWVVRKLGKKRGKEARGIAWAVVKKIEKEGIPPHPFIRPAIEDGRQEYGLSDVQIE